MYIIVVYRDKLVFKIRFNFLSYFFNYLLIGLVIILFLFWDMVSFSFIVELVLFIVGFFVKRKCRDFDLKSRKKCY